MQTNMDSQLQAATSALERCFDITVKVLVNAILLKHPETVAHSERVSVFAILIARAMRLSSESIREIARGALLHDVGKLAVPDDILRKAGPLDRDEIEVMRSHCRKGFEVVKNVPFLKEAAEIIYAHHENYDGGGYPRGLRGEGMPLGARIVSVANAFDI